MPNSYKVEFYGGPRDGEDFFQNNTDFAEDVYSGDIEVRPGVVSEVHHYTLKKSGTRKFKYIYQGIVPAECE